jgi:hypothetical protein
MSQKSEILSHLRTRRSLTPLEALKKFGCMRLGARIWELKRDGHRIESVMIDVSDDKRVASYLLLHSRKRAA